MVPREQAHCLVGKTESILGVHTPRALLGVHKSTTHEKVDRAASAPRCAGATLRDHLPTLAAQLLTTRALAKPLARGNRHL